MISLNGSGTTTNFKVQVFDLDLHVYNWTKLVLENVIIDRSNLHTYMNQSKLKNEMGHLVHHQLCDNLFAIQQQLKEVKKAVSLPAISINVLI